MTATLSVIGQRVGRIEGPSKVSGGAQFTADFQLPGRLFGKVFRSSIAHGRIVHLDVSRARALPGVKAVLTAADIPPLMVGRRVKDQPALARDKVRFIGDRVALVAAIDADVAEEALSLIEIEYDELPAVFDPDEALREDAPRVHEDPRSYTGAAQDMPVMPNLQSYNLWGIGDVEQGFAESDLIFEQTFTTSRNHQVYLEPHSVTVAVQPDGSVKMWASCKGPYQARGWVAKAADLPEEQVTVYPAHMGGDFGGKGDHGDQEVCYLLSKATGQPVTMIMTYVDELTAGAPRHPATIHLKTGLKKDGRIWARDASMIVDGGAYASMKPAGSGGIGGFVKGGGAYKIPHTKIECIIAYTNSVPCGHMRSPGSPQTLFAVESHMDFLAEQLGMDPLEFRLLNALKDGDAAPNGDHWHNVLEIETLQRAKEFTGWGQPKPPPQTPGRVVGRGLSLGFYSTGSGEAGVTFQVSADGKVNVVTALPDTGTGSLTIIQQIAAEILQVPLIDVTVERRAPGQAPIDGGSGASRVTHVVGTATLNTAQKTRETLMNMASEYLGCPSDQVELVSGSFRERQRPDNELSWSDLAARVTSSEGGPLEVTEIYKGHSPHEESFQAYVVEVEVDRDTGKYQILQIQAVDEVGPLLNPVNAEGQLQGGMMMGIGMAIMEEMKLEDGRVTTVGLHDYKVPTIADAPPLRTDYITDGMGSGPFGAKGVGELGIVAIAPAIANAIHDAIGERFTHLPITAEDIYFRLHGDR
jgi:CO/xanthine dehydrogenase Mo-binding subunit